MSVGGVATWALTWTLRVGVRVYVRVCGARVTMPMPQSARVCVAAQGRAVGVEVTEATLARTLRVYARACVRVGGARTVRKREGVLWRGARRGR